MPYAPPTGIGVGIDLWSVKFFPLKSDGTIDAPPYPVAAETPYEGLTLGKAKTLQPNLGAPRTIPVVAQGRVQTTFILPPTDAKTAELHLAYIDMEVFAELSKVKTRTIGGARGMAAGTNKQGLELSGAMLVSQLQFHTDDGLDAWHSYLFPRVKAAITWPAFNENPIDVTVTMSLSSAKKHLWGAALTEADDGATEFAMWPFQTWGLPNIVAWVGDAAETTFLLPADAQANSTFVDTFVVYNSTTGAVISGTPSAANFIAGAAPAANAIVMGFYEQVEG